MTSIKNLLPIGSVVKLDGVDKKLTVMGIRPANRDGEQYDYLGVAFPEGFTGVENMFLFNHEFVESVEYIGSMDGEFYEFRDKLATALEQGE